jgi:hypothetical protein
MGYPGDQQQPGGWAPRRPPQSPYPPADDQATQVGRSSYGGGRDDSPYGVPPSGSPYEGAPSEPSYGGGPPYEDQYPTESPYGEYGQNPYEYDQDGYDQGSYDSGPSYGDDGHDGHGGRGRHGDDGSGSGSGKKRLIIGASVVAGLIVVGGTAVALTSGGDKKPSPGTAAKAKATPTVSPTPTATATGKGDRLQSRTTDPHLLTLNEVFKARTFKAGGRSYLMTMRRHDRKCSSGAHGTSFRKALTRGRCDQVLRATFSNGKLIGTIGIINLESQSAAIAAQTASRPKDAFIVPLPGSSGVTKKIGQGLSLTTAEADGHYLIMSWVQYPDGKKITKSDYSAVTSFVRNTTLGSNLRPALNYRSMEGKPS